VWGLVCAVLVLTTIANWQGWRAAADRATRAERTWVKSLSHHDPAQRSYALETLSVLAPWESETTDAIHRACDDADMNVRAAAYRAFEQNPEAARSHLAEFVGRLKREEQPTVRQQIEATVRALNQPQASTSWVSWAFWAGLMVVLAAVLWAGWSFWKRAEAALGGR
jgi:cation transport ATPase